MRFLVALFLVLLASTVHAGDLSFSWTAPTTNTDGSAITTGQITGYNLYCGAISGAYDEPINIKSGTTYKLAVPIGIILKYCAVTAVTANTESAKSNEVMKALFSGTVTLGVGSQLIIK